MEFPAGMPSLEGGRAAASSEKVMRLSRLSRPSRLEHHVECHHLGERGGVARLIGIGGDKDVAGAAFHHDGGVAMAADLGARRRCGGGKDTGQKARAQGMPKTHPQSSPWPGTPVPRE
jgi:hypothetical protein